MPTPRSRRVRPTRVPDSDVEMDDIPQNEEEGETLNVDVEAVAEVDQDADGESEDHEEDDDEAEEEDQEEDASYDYEEPPLKRPSSTHPTPSGSRLKIKLKLPSQPPSSRFDTPNVESEDEDDSNDDSEPASRPAKTRPMTTRQAVLASVMDSSHVSLAETRQKKPPLNETELALRREETARKRKNLTEKKLEDEKLETINRLLKKQSRPRNKRNTAQSRDQDDATPTGSGNRSNAGSRRGGIKKAAAAAAGQEGEEDAEEEDAMEVEENDAEGQAEDEQPGPVPTMYRWVSSTRPKVTSDGSAPEIQTCITFSVPVSAMPSVLAEAEPLDGGNEDVKMSERPTKPTTCSVPGCQKPFRYRYVKDWTRGACGIACLKTLEAAV